LLIMGIALDYCAGAQLLARLCALWLIVLPACEQAAPEPSSGSSSRPAKAQPAKKSKALHWVAPPAWQLERTADTGTYRAKYRIEASGGSKHGGDALVSRLSPASEPTQQLDAFLKEFEGEGVAAAKREQFSVGTLKVHLLEVGATFRFGVGPAMGEKKKRAAHVLKSNWRGLVAVVVTPERGNWLFRLVGPNDTVEAARAGFRAMVESVK
jgi:hypothetical protein